MKKQQKETKALITIVKKKSPTIIWPFDRED
jgi:hypothetical protein